MSVPSTSGVGQQLGPDKKKMPIHQSGISSDDGSQSFDSEDDSSISDSESSEDNLSADDDEKEENLTSLLLKNPDDYPDEDEDDEEYEFSDRDTVPTSSDEGSFSSFSSLDGEGSSDESDVSLHSLWLTRLT
ncbi:hypothetical protein EV421DRAFT_1907890 [Armillaria borealis]|uniref:Uncharacterized protein n=1 Tax=Armillaria borealis TaxID=47425 RepID=A0AA39J5J7_9AGAR|nr:hypothetical protein EV421DRAFT_1907890 [Armillaria borealis]